MGYILPIQTLQSKEYAERDRLKTKKIQVHPLSGVPNIHRIRAIHPLLGGERGQKYPFYNPKGKIGHDDLLREGKKDGEKGNFIDVYR